MRKKKLISGGAALAALMAVAASVAQAMPEAAQLVGPPMELPAAYSFLNILLLLTFFLHLVLINILIGSLLLAILDRYNSESVNKHGIAFLPKTLALAVNFGVAPFLFLQVLYGNYLYPAIVLMAVWWLSNFLFVMLAYYGLYVGDAQLQARRRLPTLGLAGLLLLVTAFFMTNMSTLMLRPVEWLKWFSEPHGTVLNFEDPTLLPRYLHMIIASLAVGGLAMAWRAHWSKGKPGTDANAADKRLRRGLNWFFYASLAQAAIGGLFLISQPPTIRDLFLGGNLQASAILLLAAIGLIMALLLARQGRLKPTSLTALGIILLMVQAREILRAAMLQPYIEVAPPPVPMALPTGQSQALLLFLLCAFVAVALLLWITLVVRQALKRANASGIQEG